MRRRLNAAAMAVVSGAVVLALVSIAPPARAAAAEYPTWDEVEAAKADVATRQAETERVATFLEQLEAEAGRLGDAAVSAAATSATAEAARASAAARAETLRGDASAALVEATTAGERIGRLAGMLSRTGGADVTLRLVFGAGDDVDLLAGLARARQLTNVYSNVAVRADAARDEAAAVSAQAEVAERERRRLALAAAEAADAALAAHEAAQQRAADQQSTLDTLYAQLADLRGHTVDLERRFRIGEQARRDAEERERAAAATEADRGGSAGGGGTSAPPPGVVADPAGARAYAAGAVARYGWGSAQYDCLVRLWTRESSWRADAYNASSGAYGIPQSLPGSKMASAGADWRTNAATQIEWGLSYIAGRYGAPCGAWAHSEAYNWY
ncbi:MAG TPA: hypothetical protein VM430_07085 [Microbacterium sp.]|nr:hypothetical protein [Microbacterium sp.]